MTSSPVIACPWCGGGEIDTVARKCPACGAPFSISQHVVDWSPPSQDLAVARSLWRLALRQVDPLSSRLSPLRWLTDYRVERYYKRTLRDSQLAERWRDHYFGKDSVGPGVAVLDHGCGRGRHAALLRQLGCTVGAQDVTAHRWWASIHGCTFQAVPEDSRRLPWADHVFDVALDVEVIHYLSETDLAALAGEMSRVLRPGGKWLMVEMNAGSYGAFMAKEFFRQLHVIDRVASVVSAAGFTESSRWYEGFYAPVMPRFVNFLRKVASPSSYDMADYDSRIAHWCPELRRGLWALTFTRAQ